MNVTSENFNPPEVKARARPPMGHKNPSSVPPPGESWRIFERVYPRYDTINFFLSLGLDAGWRRRLTRQMAVPDNAAILDLATGTGDVLIDMVTRYPHVRRACGLDLSRNMLAAARRKISRLTNTAAVGLVNADALRLPFPDGKFDAVTTAFGIRNVTSPPAALKEMLRVLKPEGRAGILEFSLPENAFMRLGARIYLRAVVPAVGGLLSGDWSAYRYLGRTAERFPCGEAFCRWMREAGFREVRATPLFFGAATIYQGRK